MSQNSKGEEEVKNERDLLLKNETFNLFLQKQDSIQYDINVSLGVNGFQEIIKILTVKSNQRTKEENNKLKAYFKDLKFFRTQLKEKDQEGDDDLVL